MKQNSIPTTYQEKKILLIMSFVTHINKAVTAMVSEHGGKFTQLKIRILDCSLRVCRIDLLVILIQQLSIWQLNRQIPLLLNPSSPISLLVTNEQFASEMEYQLFIKRILCSMWIVQLYKNKLYNLWICLSLFMNNCGDHMRSASSLICDFLQFSSF